MSVTELLNCQRMQKDVPLSSNSVEHIVKTAIAYSEESPARSISGRWAAIYVLSLLVGGVGVYLNFVREQFIENAIAVASVATFAALGAVFGAYFCFFARKTLPAYYDQNRISGVYDGAFRMNVPGLHFNNSNWKYIVLVGRIWACLTTALFPLLVVLASIVCPKEWNDIAQYVLLILPLPGLFVPMYMVGKRFE